MISIIQIVEVFKNKTMIKMLSKQKLNKKEKHFMIKHTTMMSRSIQKTKIYQLLGLPKIIEKSVPEKNMHNNSSVLVITTPTKPTCISSIRLSSIVLQFTRSRSLHFILQMWIAPTIVIRMVTTPRLTGRLVSTYASLAKTTRSPSMVDSLSRAMRTSQTISHFNA